jgi:enediyne biosynthesis protein E4
LCCAFIDYDNDGWEDIFLLSGTRLTGDPPGATNRLYKNNRDGTFTDGTEKAGLKETGWASSVCIGDYNNDGYEDIFCTYYGQNHLYRNHGDGTVRSVAVTDGKGASVALQGTGSAWQFEGGNHQQYLVRIVGISEA